MLNNRLHFESHFSLSHTTNNFTDTARVNHDFEGNIYPSPNGQEETGSVPHASDDNFFEFNERINFDYKISSNHNFNLNVLFNYAHEQPRMISPVSMQVLKWQASHGRKQALCQDLLMNQNCSAGN